MSIGTIASNYTEEARKASITLTTIYTYVKHLLDTRTVTDTDPPWQIKIKEVPSAEAESNPPPDNPTEPEDPTASSAGDLVANNTVDLIASESAASRTTESVASKASKPVDSKASRRPGLLDFVVKELLRGHTCLYADCAPNLKQEMYDRARRNILRDKERIIGAEKRASV